MSKPKLHDERAELALLGSALVDPGCLPEVATIVSPEDFYVPGHRPVFEAMLALMSANRPIDMVTLSNALPEDYEDLVFEMFSAVPTSVNAIHYAEVVAAESQRRRLVAAGEAIATRAVDRENTADEALRAAEDLVFSIGRERQSGQVSTSSEAVSRFLDDVLSDAAPKPVSSSLIDLDNLIGGFYPGRVYLIGGRPGMGKSGYAIQAVLDAAQAGRPSVIFSLEMSERDVVKRMISRLSGISGRKIQERKLDDNDMAKIAVASGELESLPVHIDDSRVTPEQVRSKCLAIKAKHGLGLVVIDYAQIMAINERMDSGYAKQSHISDMLRVVAKDLDVPILALVQLSRAVEHRMDKTPTLADIRDSGQYEQDAHAVIFVHRPGYYDESLMDQSMSKFYVAKNRSGPTGTAVVNWDPGTTSFWDRAHSDQIRDYAENAF